jgi:membrane-associated phospholipid phosphatase
MSIKNEFRKNIIFIIAILTVLTVGLFVLLILGKEQSFILLNGYHRHWLDDFFTYYTYLGNGLFSVVVFLILFILKKKTMAVAILISFLLSGILAQILKRIFSMPRPKIVFNDGLYQHFIDGVTVSGHHSFPSGHTATAFAMLFTFILLVKHTGLKWAILFLSIMVGYSRIYLGQHFLSDVLAGIAVGILSGAVAVYLEKKMPPKLRA